MNSCPEALVINRWRSTKSLIGVSAAMKRLSPKIGIDLSQFHSIVALAIYSALSLLYFSFRKLPEFWTQYRGLGADPTIHMWAMSWWPHAIAHHLNPLVTKVIFAPGGYNLARAVNLPAPSLIIYPVTRALGPVMAYNVLCLACPIAAAFAAFVLCRYICRCFWPALLGGYIFGFSEYVLSEIGSHLFLLFIFPVPLVIYLVLLRINGAISKYLFQFLFILILALEFLSSTELFATTTLFGAMGLMLSVVIFAEQRPKLISIVADVACAYAILVLVLSPYLYYVLAGGVPQVLNPPEAYSNDALAFMVPTPVLLGGELFRPVSAGFRDVWTEMAAYVGPGVWLIMVLFARRDWGSKPGKLLLLAFGFIMVASLGPKLHFRGTPYLRLPWFIIEKLPLINLALPGRFGMYLFLVAGLIVTLYLSSSASALWFRVSAGFCAVAFLIPNLAFVQGETTRVNTPAFFRTGLYKTYISRGDVILILPNTINSTSQALLWQAQTNFYFRSVTGFYLPPEEYQRWPISSSFVDGHRIPNSSEQLKAFLGAHEVREIILDGESVGSWPRMLSEAGMTGIALGGIRFYKTPLDVIEAFHGATAHLMAEKAAAASFGALLNGASRYVDSQLPLAKLTPSEAHRLGLLGVLQDTEPPVAGSNWWNNLWLGSWADLVGIGISGDYEDLEFLIRNYGSEAVQVFFPFPQKWEEDVNYGDGQLLFLFKPEGLRRATRNTIAPRSVELNETLTRATSMIHH